MQRRKSLKELIDHELLIANYEERITAHQREIDLLKGNLAQETARREALDRYLGISYTRVRGHYKKNKK